MSTTTGPIPSLEDSLNPQITPGVNSSIQSLAMQALRRYGDFVPGSIDGDVILMFIDFANLIIDEVRAHPYYVEAYQQGKAAPLSYYVAASDTRPIPDVVIVAGLLYHYAAQQGSNKAQTYMPAFARTLSQQLWGLLQGHDRIEMKVVDGGSRGGRS
jgi:hypothetical protein